MIIDWAPVSLLSLLDIATLILYTATAKGNRLNALGRGNAKSSRFLTFYEIINTEM